MAPPPSSSSRLLFGSCNSQSYEQVLWPNILQRNASVFVWAGDAVYTDASVPAATPTIARELYQAQRDHSRYQQLLETGIPILGVMDDHDYGVDNGDKTYPHRVESAVLFACDFLNHQDKMCDRAKRGDGAYGIHVMDFSRPKGFQLLTEEEAGLDPEVVVGEASPPLGERTVAFFLLDIRSNKTPYKNKIGPGPGDFLGEKQWEWLEKALNRSTAAVNLIVSGLQVHADRRPAESWSRFPLSQHRLYQAILQANVRAPILVSGDVHHAQLLRRDCWKKANDHNKQMLLEVTTSGMTHSWGSREQCARPHRSWLCRNPFVQWMLGKGMYVAQHLNGYLAWTEVLYLEPNQVTEEGRAGLQFALERNFAEMEFHWEERYVIVRVLGEDSDAVPLLSHKWAFDELSPTLGSREEAGSWVCQNYRGEANAAMKALGVVVPGLGVFAGLLSPFLLVVWILRIGYTKYAMIGHKAKQS